MNKLINPYEYSIDIDYHRFVYHVGTDIFPNGYSLFPNGFFLL